MKKMLDNLPNKPELNDLKSKVFNNYVANIRNSFEKLVLNLVLDQMIMVILI